MYVKNYTRRRRVVFLAFFILFFICLLRLFFIQCFRSKHLVSLARKQQNFFIHLEPQRGTIFDRNLRPQAVNLPSESLYAVPVEVKDKETTIKVLLPILKKGSSSFGGFANEAEWASGLKKRLSSDKYFVWLARKLSQPLTDEVRNLHIKGLYFIKESRRVYPNLHMASQLIGFAGLDNKGLEGIELAYDKYLMGTSGWGVLLRDARQERLGLWEKLVLPSNGYYLILTIDEVIQFIVEHELDRIVRKFHARGPARL